MFVCTRVANSSFLNPPSVPPSWLKLKKNAKSASAIALASAAIQERRRRGNRHGVSLGAHFHTNIECCCFAQRKDDVLANVGTEAGHLRAEAIGTRVDE
jgi:hypothetical protein